MARWSELKKNEKNAILIFVVIVAILLILAWYGYFTGAWEQPEGKPDANQGTVFTNQQAGWSSGQGNSFA
jgi:apolipoprotein N-acyltransferase